MTPAQSFLAQMRRQPCGPVFMDMSLCPSQREAFERHTGSRDTAAAVGSPVRSVSAAYVGGRERFRPYFTPELYDACTFNAWGLASKPGPFYHFEERLASMKAFSTKEAFDAYPFPDPQKDFDWEQVAQQIKDIHARGLAAVAQMQDTLFHIAWQLRGMDTLFMDMLDDRELADALLDRVAAVRTDMAHRYASLGADILFLGDDIATQRGMLMQPALWREQIKARFPDIIGAARAAKPDILIAYHSCGNVTDVIPDLIEIGVDILNPLQPECMDPFAVKAQYGTRLSFWGGVGTQQLLPYADSQEVYQSCMALLEKMADNGGYLLSPAHVVEPEVPFENIQAMIRALKDFNGRGADK